MLGNAISSSWIFEKLTEREEERVEVDLRFFLLHILLKVSPCGYVEVMGAYRMEKIDGKIQKMTNLGADLVITYSNLFVNYEQDMVKICYFLLLL
jgi:hypothetical protein